MSCPLRNYWRNKNKLTPAGLRENKKKNSGKIKKRCCRPLGAFATLFYALFQSPPEEANEGAAPRRFELQLLEVGKARFSFHLQADGFRRGRATYTHGALYCRVFFIQPFAATKAARVAALDLIGTTGIEPVISRMFATVRVLFPKSALPPGGPQLWVVCDAF